MSSESENRSVNWKYLLISLGVALLLWYTVNAREQIERVVDVRLDYKGLPAGLVVTSGQVNKISVRLRGPMELLRSLSNRELFYTLDLSGLTKGNNIVSLTSDPVPELRAIQAVEVIPPRLTLTVDELMERRVPVVPRLHDSLFGKAVRMVDAKAEPDHVLAHGPSASVSLLRELVVEVPVDGGSEDVPVSNALPVLAPPTVDVSPASVTVWRRVVFSRKNVSLQRDVLSYDAASELDVRPARVSVVVAVPETLVRDTEYLAQVQVYVRAGEGVAAEGESSAPVDVRLPQGARLIRVTPEKVDMSSRR